MSKHIYFEELCAIASLNGLTEREAREFEAHAAGCDACRQRLQEYTELQRSLTAVDAPATDAIVASSREHVEQAMWAGIAAQEEAPHRPQLAILPVMHARRVPRLVWGVAAAVVLIAASFTLGIHYDRAKQPPVAAIQQPTPPTAAPSPAPSADDAALKAQLSAERDHNSALAQEKDNLAQRNAGLQQKLSADDQEIAQALALQQTLEQRIAQQSSLVNSTQAQLDSTKAALSQAESARSSNVATVAALEYQLKDLQDKLGTQTASLDREKDLLSHGREIRDIIGARNLHIIDVYDTDTDGDTKKAFARAFYTEGKSLVFYAYDLPQRQADSGKYKYVAWGEKNGSATSVRKIGFLFHDDQTQRRWSLNFADPKVLSEIDSVFVTLERVNEDESQPRGKRMLTAFLGTPANHP